MNWNDAVIYKTYTLGVSNPISIEYAIYDDS